MATWMTHFRIADKLIDIIGPDKLDLPAFVIGNIAPDCGTPNSDGLTYTPDKDITHFGYTEDRDYKKFRQEYLEKSFDNKSRSLYLGYYLHLLTDEEWGRLISSPKIENMMKKNPDEGAVSEKIRSDGFDLDKLYLEKHPQMRAYKIFTSVVSFPNVYFEFFPEDAFEVQINRIRDFYNNLSVNAEKEYRYLTEKELEWFIENAVVNMVPKIKKLL